jgi:hypothetical protein
VISINPNLVGDRSPTPPIVYQPRLWRVRIWTKTTPFQGAGVVFKAPYGVAVNAADLLARACARYQISRYTFGPVPAYQLKRWTKADRDALQRYEDAFEAVGRAHGIDWGA